MNVLETRTKAVKIMENVKRNARKDMDIDRVILFMMNMHESDVTGALKASCVVTKARYLKLAKSMARVNADEVKKSSHKVFIVTDQLNARPVNFHDFQEICDDTIKNLKAFA